MGSRFESLIALQIDGERIAVETAAQALRLLDGDWPDDSGPSYQRAVNSCRACLAENGSDASAMATFTVAAMEERIPFERHDDYLAFTEARVISAVELDLKDAGAEIASNGHQAFPLP